MKIKLKLFFRSFLLSLVIFSIVAGIIMTKLYIDIIAVDPASEESNVLVGITNGNRVVSIAVLNLDPKGNCISFLPIPDNTLIPDKNSSMDEKTTLQSLYEKYGIGSLREATEGLIGAKINRYILFSTESLAVLTDGVGNVNCYIYNPFLYDNTYYSGQRSIDGKLAEAMFTYKGYDMTKVSLSDIGRSFMEGFLSDHAKPHSVGRIADTVNSDSFKKLIATDLSEKEVTQYCDFLARYEALRHRFVELAGFSTTAFSSIYFTPEITESTKNIFK